MSSAHRRSARVLLAAFGLHALVGALFWASLPALGMFLIAGGLAFATLREPRRMRSPRHRDVARFETTLVGRALKLRRAWIPSSFGPLAFILLLVGLSGPGLLAALRGLGEGSGVANTLHLAKGAFAAPPLVLLAGLVLESIVLQPLVMPLLLLLFGGFGGLFLLQGDWLRASQLGAALATVVVVLFTLDLARLGRRHLEKRLDGASEGASGP